MSFPMVRFAQDVKMVGLLTHANANADRTSEVIDTAGYGGCCVVVHFATINDSMVGTIRLASSDAVTDENTLSGGANVANSAQTIDAANADNDIKYIDFIPDKRYYQLVVDKDATNPSMETAIAYLYNAKTRPVVQSTGNTVVGEGTAEVLGEVLNLATQGTA